MKFVLELDEKFYFESFPSCEKYKNEQENEIENKNVENIYRIK